MSETGPRFDFNHTEGYKLVIWDTAEVPDEVWTAAHGIHRESIRALLPKDGQERADIIVKWGDFESYRDGRIDPSLVREFNPNQLYKRPRFTGIFDSSNQLAGWVLTADNTSAKQRTPDKLKPLECQLKMKTPPALPVPFVGGRRYFYNREAVLHPDIYRLKPVGEAAMVLNGIELVATYRALEEANDEQKMTAYSALGDEADEEMTAIISGLEMLKGGYASPHILPGYKKLLFRYILGVYKAKQNIEQMPGAKEAIERVPVSKI